MKSIWLISKHEWSVCYITIDKNKIHAITANYSSGNISVFAITEDGGYPESHTIWRQ